RYPHAEWPIAEGSLPYLKNADHSGWAVRDSAATVDVLHLNDAAALPFTTFVDLPAVLTIHHPHEPTLSDMYEKYPDVHYVTIANWLAGCEPMPKLHVVHHGIPIERYRFASKKDDFVMFLGRMAPCKGPHLAIAAARAAGMAIKLAGEIQPTFHDYWQRDVE